MRAIALTEVFGEGQKLNAVAVEFDGPISGSGLTASTFSVADRRVTRVYANANPAVTSAPTNGRFAIIELDGTDPKALLWNSNPGSTGPGPSSAAAGTGTSVPAAPATTPSVAGPPLGSTNHPVIETAKATVTQRTEIRSAGGQRWAPDGPVTTSGTIDPIVDKFAQRTFNDQSNRNILPYNLYVPEGYDHNKSYPVMLFMHDASVVGAPVKGPLVQGLGAVCWASPEDQKRQPCFVVAPTYPSVVVSDDYQPTTYFDTTLNLLDALAHEYSIDRSRLHATGQSMGAMMTLGMDIRHPGLFASSYVVAGQWPSEQAAPLARAKLWITVSQGDTKAYPGENAILGVVEQNGGRVTTATWDGRWTQPQFAAGVSEVESKNTPINYTSLLPGTVPATGGGASEHMGTWKVAYGIPGIRRWIMGS
ncbi:hypothetical protein LH935_24020 [Gordonia polyisoprenivorans]|nr:hypothetical protein LH935_24020 [Gordonia polyisoprenivorans]